MSYYIQYTQGIARKTELKGDAQAGKNRMKALSLIIMVTLFLIAVGMGWNAEFLIPGDREITKAAFMELVEDVEAGEDLRTAITTFCREVISGAETEDDSRLH